MRIVSLNANGIRAAERKGFFDWILTINPDLVCLQETKAHKNQLNEKFFPNEYVCEYVEAEKKGYSGVAIFSRKKPRAIITTMNDHIADKEGRYLQFDFEHFSIVSLYLPSGSSGEERQQVKYQFLDSFENHLLHFKNTNRPLIICGDLNIVHKERDIKNWKGNQKNSGCLPEERAWLDKLFGEMAFVDAFREVNQQAQQYTWWSNRGQAWLKNVGWRIDYQVISSEFSPAVKHASIYKDQRFSDHAPLVIDYDFSALFDDGSPRRAHV
jgi:exodeoxyribonuclease III